MVNFQRWLKSCRTKFAHPAIWRFDLYDEPSAKAFDYLGDVVGYTMRECPEFPAFINLFPNYASVIETTLKERESQLGTSSYQEHIDQYCEKVPLDFIQFDHYIYRDNADYVKNDRYGRLITNLTIVADACRRTGRSFWFAGHVVNPIKNKIRLSANKLRYQVYISMAYGAELVNWPCWAPCWWFNTVIEADGTVSDHYGKFCTINRECHRLGETYMRYRNVATRLETAEDGSRLAIGDMVSRVKGDPSTATYVFGADDIFDEKRASHRIYLKSPAKRIVGVDGDIQLQKAEDGREYFTLEDNRPAIICR